MPGYTRDDLIYLAGIIDGEGSIEVRLGRRSSGVGTSAGNMVIQVTVGNTDERLILWLTTTFGGRVHKYYREGVKNLYLWRIPVRRERELMEAVLPHLKLKSEQLRLAFRLADTAIIRGRGKCVPQETLLVRQQIAAEVSRLKRV